MAVLLLASPTEAATTSVQNLIRNTNSFLGNTLLPAMMAIAFLFLVFNVGRYFVLESDNEEGRAKAKSLAIYGTLTFIVIVIFWGLINLFADTVGLADCYQPMTDYEKLNFIGPHLPDCP